jgi:hypothetical protein
MFNYANDIDIYQEWANVVVHNEFRATYTRKYHCCYIGRKFNKRYVHTHEQAMEKLGALVVLHTPVSGVFRSALGDHGYLVRSRSRDEIQAAIRILHATRQEPR